MKLKHAVLRRFAPAILALAAIALANPALAVEYGGIGGRPANPRPDNPRTDSIFVFDIKPGETLHDAVRVINNTADTKTLMVYAADSETSSGGAFACRQFAEPKQDVGNWITLEKSQLTLESMTNEVVPFTITAPKSADVGEHNGCILIQELKAPVPGGVMGGNGVMLSFRTGLRVAVLVPGEIVRKLEIAGFDAHAKPDGNEVLVASIKNTGNVSIDSDVKATVTWFGRKVASVGGQYPVLRDATSVLNFDVPKHMWGGWYAAKLVVEYDGSSGAGIGVNTGQPPIRLEGPTITYFSWPTPVGAAIEIAALLVLLIIIISLAYRGMRARIIRTTWVLHTVGFGEDINSIAKANGINWKKLADANGFAAPYVLRPGDKMRVPPKKK